MKADHPRTRFVISLLLAVTFTAVSASQAAAFWFGDPDYVEMYAPDELGPYAVGHTGFELIDPSREDRPLPVQAWYPADPEGAVGDPTQYELVAGLLTLISDNAIDDLPVNDSPWRPLVVFSHGSGGINVQSVVLMETLASHGFVVVAPNHTGNTTFDPPIPFAEMAIHRPLDISFVIDHMLERSGDPEDMFFLRINPLAIGVAGHSFGGYTALAMAAGYAAGSVAPDPRVRAIVPISAVTGLFGDEELESIRIPTLLLGGTADTVVPIDPQTVRAMELIESFHLYRVDIDGATHTHFANVCDMGNVLIDLGFPPELWSLFPGGDILIAAWAETCVEEAFPIDEAVRLQNLYTVAFLRRHLRLDLRYSPYLTESYSQENEPSATLYRANPIPWGCGLGFELSLALPLLMALRQRRRRALRT